MYKVYVCVCSAFKTNMYYNDASRPRGWLREENPNFFSIVQNSPLEIAAIVDRFKWDGYNYRNHKPAKAVRRPDSPPPLDRYRVDRETDKKMCLL